MRPVPRPMPSVRYVSDDSSSGSYEEREFRLPIPLPSVRYQPDEEREFRLPVLEQLPTKLPTRVTYRPDEESSEGSGSYEEQEFGYELHRSRSPPRAPSPKRNIYELPRPRWSRSLSRSPPRAPIPKRNRYELPQFPTVQVNKMAITPTKEKKMSYEDTMKLIDYIFISNSHMCDPSGRAHKKGFSNSNGIEVDDGSRFVWLVNNSSARCFGGVEIKAHHNSSAASDIQIIGHLSVNDNRSFNFRHIGHHKGTDPESKTAFNIRASNLVSIQPVFTRLYAGSTPRGMVVSAYRNVVINNFVLIGDPHYDYKDNPVIAVQYRARNVTLNNVTLQNFKKSGADIKVFGGDNRADHITIQNITMMNSSPGGILFGSDVQNKHVKNIKVINNERMPIIKILSKNL